MAWSITRSRFRTGRWTRWSRLRRPCWTRAAHPTSTLYDLYDPTTMPANLVKAHRKLDRKVDGLYRRKPFGSDEERVKFLFRKYGELLDQKR